MHKCDTVWLDQCFLSLLRCLLIIHSIIFLKCLLNTLKSMHLYTFNYRQQISIAWLGSHDANSSHSLPSLKAESYLKLSVTRLFIWNCNYFPLQNYTMKHLPLLKPLRAQPACKNQTKHYRFSQGSKIFAHC